MDFELFIDTDYTVDMLIHYLKNSMSSCINRNQIVNSDTDIFANVGCDLFGFLIDKEETFGINEIKAEYKVNVNQNIQISIINATFKSGIILLINVLNDFITKFEGDFLLLSNGSVEIISRRNGKVEMDRRVDYVPIEEFNIQ